MIFIRLAIRLDDVMYFSIDEAVAGLDDYYSYTFFATSQASTFS